jgi:P-loop containing NTP hydrolase pore-1
MPKHCHFAEQAKNLVPDSGGRATKVGEKVVELQRLLHNARVVYCSATGALCRDGFVFSHLVHQGCCA